MTAVHATLTSSDAPDDGELLLYYCYLDLRAAQSEVCDWMRANCASLGLVGRVRIAQDGVNCTLGGTGIAVAQHVAAVQAHPLLGSQRTDFKVAPWPHGCSAKAAAEAGFNTLAVAACKEVVAHGQTVCDVDSLPELAGAHVSPQDFDAMLADPTGSTLLVDARNVYESRIGRFEAVSFYARAAQHITWQLVRAVRAMSGCQTGVLRASATDRSPAEHFCCLHVDAESLRTYAWCCTSAGGCRSAAAAHPHLQ